MVEHQRRDSVDPHGQYIPLAIVAIPASDEAERIESCLAALAVQRDRFGAPLPAGSFETLVFANNCTDATVAVVEAFARECPHPVTLMAEHLPPDKANAGWARKRAMDLAADRLIEAGRPDGVILTTDADSNVAPTWIEATLRAFARGADAVAGYVDAHPAEMMRLGRAFVQRGRLEDCYLRAVAEIYALCDPKAHDPWPNHRVSSGASLAVRLGAYRAIGGLPPKPVGEDAALTQELERAGFRVRHAMDVCVSTSCRFDGRAKGGAADTMRHRHDVAEAPCDEDIEPALAVVRRALWKGRLRRLWANKGLPNGDWVRRLELDRQASSRLIEARCEVGFEDFWSWVSRASPVLRQAQPLRPADLPLQIERAAMCLRVLRSASVKRLIGGRADSPDHARPREPVAA